MDIQEAIRKMSGTNRNVMAIVAEVTAVSGTTCTCSPIDGSADIEDVRLQTQVGNSVLIIPSVGSKVVVQMINDVEGVVVMYSQVDSIQYLDGSFGGLIKIEDLVTKINNIEGNINDLKTAFTAWVTVPSDGGAALKAVTATWAAATITETQRAELENTKITHGDV